MKLKAIRNFLNNQNTYKIDELFETNDDNGTFLVENDFAIRLDEPKVVAEQIGLDSPAFGMNDVQIKAGPKKGKKKKNA